MLKISIAKYFKIPCQPIDAVNTAMLVKAGTVAKWRPFGRNPRLFSLPLVGSPIIIVIKIGPLGFVVTMHTGKRKNISGMRYADILLLFANIIRCAGF